MGKLVRPSMPDNDDGYPTCNGPVDGLDTKRIANREGYQKQLGRCLNTRMDWVNSKTGARCDPPDYARED